jgi:hypothetical protein
MTGYGPGLRGEPKWLYSADGGHKKNALSPESMRRIGTARIKRTMIGRPMILG